MMEIRLQVVNAAHVKQAETEALAALKGRQKNYPKLVQDEKMTKEQANHKLQGMAIAVSLLTQVASLAAVAEFESNRKGITN